MLFCVELRCCRASHLTSVQSSADLLAAVLKKNKKKNTRSSKKKKLVKAAAPAGGVVSLTLEAFVGQRQVLGRVRVNTLGADVGSHRLGVQCLAHHPPVAHDPPNDVGIHRGVDERRVEAHPEVALPDGPDRTGSAAEDP